MGSAAGAARRYGLLDATLLGWSLLWTAVSLVAFGLTTAIIPNPIFGRGIPPEPFAIGVWLASAPLMGFVMATYFVPPPPATAALAPVPPRAQGTTAGVLGSAVAFLAIGCPTCNKIALLLLGTSGAVSVFGPIQPILGAASLALLAGTVAWRLRLRARGGACALPLA